jgi:predicted DCC family thiol-disulfide oxidoreductase YuxK
MPPAPSTTAPAPSPTTGAARAVAPDPVLLFDGECGLCNRTVRWLLRIDRRGVLRFAPLQGAAAQEFLRAQGLPPDDFDSLVFVADWARRNEPAAGVAAEKKFALRTDGVVAALRAVGARRRAALLALWPRAVRDAGYGVVVRTRYRFFGGAEACPRPRPEWRARVLE